MLKRDFGSFSPDEEESTAALPLPREDSEPHLEPNPPPPAAASQANNREG